MSESLPPLSESLPLSIIEEKADVKDADVKDDKDQYCLNCNKKCKNILMHIQRSKTNCGQFYDVEKLKLERRTKTKDLKTKMNVVYKKNQRKKEMELNSEEMRKKK